MPTQPSIRPELTLDAFRRYEGVIREALESYPRCVRIIPPPAVNATTYAARLRDALRGLKTYGYGFEPPLADRSQMEFVKRLNVFFRGDSLYLGDARSVQQAERVRKATTETVDLAAGQLAANSASSAFVLDLPSTALAVESYAHLADLGIVGLPVARVPISGPDIRELVDSLKSRYPDLLVTETPTHFLLQ